MNIDKSCECWCYYLDHCDLDFLYLKLMQFNP